MRLRATAAFVLLLLASFVFAQDSAPPVTPTPDPVPVGSTPAAPAPASTIQTVLTPDSSLYAIDNKPGAKLELIRRRGEVRDPLVVPTTDDDAIDSQARIAYDTTADVVYVLWHRAAEGVDELRLASVNAAGEWSEVRTIASGADVKRAGLQLAITHAREEGDTTDTTLVHAAWWSVGETFAPEYAVAAFEGVQYLSTETANLETLVSEDYYASAVEKEDTGNAEHPPLVMSRAGRNVDVLFGGKDTTAVTRVRVEPQRISIEARIWRPSGRSLQKTTPGKLIAHGTEAVQAFVAGERVVLFTPDQQFRYIVYDNGEWTPIRMIELDENLSSDHVLQELRRTVEEGEPLETKPHTD
jgi:hypothetical protein